MCNINIYLTVLFILCTSILRQSHGAAMSIYEKKKYEKTLANQGLYTFGEHIDIFNANDLKERVYNQKHASLVEFYNSWCGFCIRFAPMWKTFANDVKRWSGIVRIGAVDCANEENTELCRTFEIMAYPTLRFFHIDYKDGESKIGKEIKKAPHEDQLRVNLVQQLKVEHEENRQGPKWPDLSYFKDKDLSGIWKGISKEVKYIFLIFEADNSTVVGNEVALDLYDINTISIRTVLNETGLSRTLGIKQFPGLAVISKDYTGTPINSKDNTRESIVAAIQTFLISHKLPVPPSSIENEVDATKGKEVENVHIPSNQELMDSRQKAAIRNKMRTMKDAVFQADLETVIRYCIFREIPKYSHIKGEPFLALKNFLQVISKYVHMGPAGRSFLYKLNKNIQAKKEISGGEFTSLVESLSNGKTIFSTTTWLGCEGSKPEFRGYPCGLWTLFHHLTVSAADDVAAEPQEVLQAMHGYIKHFFGCADCSQHFQDMAARNKIWNIAGTDEAVLWLWSAHNEVNKRLAGDATEDSEHPKKQFPIEDHCPECHKNNGWDHIAVLNYLKQIHAKNNISLLTADFSVLVDQPHKEKYISARIFSQLDFSLILMLYISCAIVLVFAVRLFLRKSYRKKMYVHDLLGKV